ncbi:MAG: hypothetical protein Kow00108_21200 [Calditrichia bacterium]
MKKYILLLIIVFSSLWGQGTTSGNLLKLPVGSGLYGSGYLSYNGYGTMFNSLYHPAKVLNSQYLLVQTYYSNLGWDLKFVNFIGIIPVNESFALGMGYQQLIIPGIPRFDAVGSENGTIDVGSVHVPVLMGYRINQYFSIGAKLGYYSEILDNYSANAFVFSGGIMIQNTGIDGLSFLFSVLNAGQKLKFYQEKESLPFGFAGTMEYISSNYPVGAFIHGLKYKDEKIRVALGLEYNYLGQFFVKTGYQITEMDDKGWMAGLGIRLKNWSLSYDYIPSNILDDRHGIGLSFHFKPRKSVDVTKYEKKIPKSSLPAPDNLEYSYVNGKLIVMWNYELLDFPNATFEVFISKSENGPWHRLDYKKLQSRSIEFEPSESNFILYFKVRAVVDGENSPFSKSLKVTSK